MIWLASGSKIAIDFSSGFSGTFIAWVKAYVFLSGCAATNSYSLSLMVGSAAAVGGGVPPELLDTGAAALLPWSGAEVVIGVGLGVGVGDTVGLAVGAETGGTIVPRFTVTVAKEITPAGPRFKALSETEFAFKDIPTVTPSAHRLT